MGFNSLRITLVYFFSHSSGDKVFILQFRGDSRAMITAYCNSGKRDWNLDEETTLIFIASVRHSVQPNRASKYQRSRRKSACDNMSLYDKSLDSNRQEIRLLSIVPGQEAEDIQCTLSVVSLRDDPKYTALSYVWGDSNTKKQISVNRTSFYVTLNLESALRHIRMGGRSVHQPK